MVGLHLLVAYMHTKYPDAQVKVISPHEHLFRPQSWLRIFPLREDHILKNPIKTIESAFGSLTANTFIYLHYLDDHSTTELISKTMPHLPSSAKAFVRSAIVNQFRNKTVPPELFVEPTQLNNLNKKCTGGFKTHNVG